MSEPAAFDGFNGQLGSSLSGGKRKKGNGHKASCGCPICNNMRKKGKKGGVLLVGGALKCKDADGNLTVEPEDDGVVASSPSGGGRRRRSRSKSRSRSRSRSSRKSMQGGKKRKSKRRR